MRAARRMHACDLHDPLRAAHYVAHNHTYTRVSHACMHANTYAHSRCSAPYRDSALYAAFLHYVSPQKTRAYIEMRPRGRPLSSIKHRKVGCMKLVDVSKDFSGFFEIGKKRDNCKKIKLMEVRLNVVSYLQIQFYFLM